MAVVKEVALPGSASGTSSSRRRATGRRRAPPVGRPRARAVRTRGPRHVARPPSPRSGGRPHARGAPRRVPGGQGARRARAGRRGLAVDRLPLAGGSPFAVARSATPERGRGPGSRSSRSCGTAPPFRPRPGGRAPGRGRPRRRRDAEGDRGARGPAPLGPSGARLAVPDRARRRRPVARGPLEDRGAVRVLADPLHLLAGLAFGQGGVVPLVTADEFIAAGAEIGLILLLFTLGLEYSARELVDALRSNRFMGGIDLLVNFAPGFAAGVLLGWGSSPPCSSGDRVHPSSGVIARTSTTSDGWGTGRRRSSWRSWCWRTS